MLPEESTAKTTSALFRQAEYKKKTVTFYHTLKGQEQYSNVSSIP